MNSTSNIEDMYSSLGLDVSGPVKDILYIYERIVKLQACFQENKKDYRIARTIVRLVAHKRSLMSYLKRKNIEQHQSLVNIIGK